ncbi:MAG: ATP-binding protein [Tenuifilaceae bacterium]
MEKFEINPFDRSALTDYRLLAGRKNEFTQIRFILRNASNQQDRVKSILISGDRGVGKTSILNLIETECLPNNLIPIRINLTETNSFNSNEFFWYLFSQIINKVFSLEFFGGKSGLIDTAIQKILFSDGIKDHVNYVFRTPLLRKNYLLNQNINFEFDQFVEDLKTIRKEITSSQDSRFNNKTKFYFLIDEAQYIYSNSKILEDIRFIIQHQAIGIGFVFAGDTSYSTSDWERVFGGTYREFEIINLNYFSEVESVIEYFTKSLESIGWSTDEIENSLFYRFKNACRQIFYVTSGKPAWINTIASKMFERCMKKESLILKFDKQAQADIKKLLEDSGQIDSNKLDFIASLTDKYQRWLAVLFSCELNTFAEVYFYSKFKLIDDNYIDIQTYTNFCQDLVNKEILSLIDRKTISNIGFKISVSENDFLNNRYYAFDFDSDSIKQWLQIHYEGKFSFGLIAPGNKYMMSINLEQIADKCNTSIASTPFIQRKESLCFASIIDRINNNQYSVSEELYESVEVIYKFYKKLSISKEREVLYGCLKNLSTGNYKVWNIYNYDDSGKLLGFFESTIRLKKQMEIVNSYKSEEHNYELELKIYKINKHDIDYFQKLIIESKDTKKIGIILEDKLNDLVKFYIKDSNVDSSYKTAIFFYKLFEEGHELNIRTLNNSAYVFLAKDEISKATILLKEAKRKILFESMDKDEIGSACVALYNFGILHIKNHDLSKAFDAFKEAVNFIETKDNLDDSAGVLNILSINDSKEIVISEVKEGDKNYPKIYCKSFALNNIEILEKKLYKN